jgi:hypothetical protein
LLVPASDMTHIMLTHWVLSVHVAPLMSGAPQAWGVPGRQTLVPEHCVLLVQLVGQPVVTHL